MIARKEDGGWTLIRQADHALHCGKLALAWRGGPFGQRPAPASLEYAAAYHDLGWREVDANPELDEGGQPRNFTRIDEARHTSFYSAAVRTIAQTDPLAAYLVSLHASGLYGRRYGWTGLKPVDWTGIGEHGRELLARERQFRTELFASIPADKLEFEAIWRGYMLLETLDYLSLQTCLGFDSPGCGPVPTVGGQWEHLAVSRVDPWCIALDPFPFVGEEFEVEVDAVHVNRAVFDSSEQLRADFLAAPPARRATVYRRMRAAPPS